MNDRTPPFDPVEPLSPDAVDRLELALAVTAERMHPMADIDAISHTPTPPRRNRLWLAAAAAAVVVVVGGGFALGGDGDDPSQVTTDPTVPTTIEDSPSPTVTTPTTEAPTPTTEPTTPSTPATTPATVPPPPTTADVGRPADPVALLEQFVATWNRGDTESARSLTGAEAQATLADLDRGTFELPLDAAEDCAFDADQAGTCTLFYVDEGQTECCARIFRFEYTLDEDGPLIDRIIFEGDAG